MQKRGIIASFRAKNEIDERIGFKYRAVYMYDEEPTMHCHDYYEIILILAPHVVHYINGTEENLSRGNLVFVRKEDVHTFEYIASKECSLCNIVFEEEILKELFRYLGAGFPADMLLSEPMPPCVMIQDNDIQWFQKQIERLNTIGTEEYLKMNYYGRLFLMKIFTRYLVSGVTTYEDSSIPEWLMELCKEMQKPKNFSVGNERMIALSGRSKEHLGRMMKKYYGVTLSEYINNLRLNFFSNMLINSDMPVIDICYECGYQNVSYAYRKFQKKYGVSPLKYRKMNQ